VAIFDTLTFPEIDGITGAPTIDGWTADIDPGVRTNKAESGYAVGGRLTYSGGAGFPPVTVGATRVNIGIESPLGCDAGSYLALSFFCTFDFSFDNADAVTIALLPGAPPYGAQPPYTEQRRIDIYPVHNVYGAGGVGGTVQTLPGNDGYAYDARFGENDRGVDFWAGIVPTADPNNPAAPLDRWQSMSVIRRNFVVHTASWRPKTSSTTTSGSATVSTGTATVVPVGDASRFPPAAEFNVQIPNQQGVTTVAYTGRDLTTTPMRLTGCKVVGGPGGTIPSGTTITLVDVGWSFEVLIPTTAQLGTEGGAVPWIDLGKEFGLYIDLIRFSQTAPAGTPGIAAYYASQYRFPLLEASANQPYVKSLDQKTAIEPSWYGTGLIPALGASNKARGVQFQPPDDQAIGVRHPGSNALTSQILQSQDNSLVALLQNNGPEAKDVTAEFRFARWGAPPAEFGEWDPASLHNAEPATKVTLPAGTAAAPTQGEVTELWHGADVPDGYVNSNMGHHCMWAALSSDQGVAFVKAGTRANFVFKSMSDVDMESTISGKGYPAPSGGRHGFLLMPHMRTVLSGGGGDGGGEDGDGGGDLEGVGIALTHGEVAPTQLWLWVVETFRRTGETITVAGTTAEIIDPAPGQFSVLAAHDGQSDVFSSSLAGDDVQRRGRTYEVSVPHGGETVVAVKLRAGPESDPLPDPTPPSPVPWWLRFIRWLIALIKKLFGKS
jgi:hypothetical protein